MSTSAFAYGLDGMFGGRPNPNGTVTVDVPLQTEETPDRAQSVLQHPHPDYDPQPIRLGSFIVNPAVTAGVAYNSNIYETPQATSDGILALQPSVTASSDWGRHFVSMTAASELDFFQNHPDQNLDTAVFQVDGRYDLLQQTWLAGRAGYQLQAVPRSTLNNNVGNSPTSFNLYNAGMTAYRGVGILQAQLDYDFDRFDFANTPGGTNNPSSLQFSRDENKGGGKFSYVVSEDFKPYVAVHVNEHTYDTTTSLNSQGYRADAGVDWDFGGVTSLEIYTGWLSQDYASYGAAPLDQGVDFGGKLTWNVTGLTTLVLDSDRSIQDSEIAGFNSFMATGGSATLTHELRRNVLLEGDVAYTEDQYQGFGSRTDDITTAGTGVRWLINRALFTDLDYSWNHRTSSAEQQGYVEHLVIAKLGVRF